MDNGHLERVVVLKVECLVSATTQECLDDQVKKFVVGKRHQLLRNSSCGFNPMGKYHTKITRVSMESPPINTTNQTT